MISSNSSHSNVCWIFWIRYLVGEERCTTQFHLHTLWPLYNLLLGHETIILWCELSEKLLARSYWILEGILFPLVIDHHWFGPISISCCPIVDFWEFQNRRQNISTKCSDIFNDSRSSAWVKSQEYQSRKSLMNGSPHDAIFGIPQIAYDRILSLWTP